MLSHENERERALLCMHKLSGASTFDYREQEFFFAVAACMTRSRKNWILIFNHSTKWSKKKNKFQFGFFKLVCNSQKKKWTIVINSGILRYKKSYPRIKSSIKITMSIAATKILSWFPLIIFFSMRTDNF